MLWGAAGLGGTTGAERAAAATAIAALPPELAPNVAWAAGELFAGTIDDRFEFGLATLLDGLERRRPRA